MEQLLVDDEVVDVTRISVPRGHNEFEYSVDMEEKQRPFHHHHRSLIDPSKITLRPIQRSDRDPVKLLHEEWFPVKYQDEFYNDLAEGVLAGIPLFTRLAIYNEINNNNSNSHFDRISPIPDFDYNNDEEENEEHEMGDDDDDGFVVFDEEAGMIGRDEDGEDSSFLNQCHGFDDGDENEGGGEEQEELQQHPLHFDEGHEDDIIAGCVVGSFMPVTRLPKSLQNVLVSDPLRYPKLFYIMTLGTVEEFRGAGLGTRLVQQCIKEVEKEPECGTLYLHVITYNQGAIRLYEKLGFYRVQEIPNYYDIRGQKYPCYLYAKHFHGNREHRGMYKFLTQWVWSFVKHVMQLAHIPPALLLGNSRENNHSDWSIS